jgi:hypothetical protein
MSAPTQRPVDLFAWSWLVHLLGTPGGDNGPEEVAMAKIRRNGPCPCGSGSKAKRCCYGNNGALEIHHLPAELCEEVIPDLKRIDREEFRALFDQLVYLPEIDTSLQQRLGILTPDMDRAISALQDDDVEDFDEVLDKVVADVDSPERRLELAQAVLTLRDEGRIPCDLAAAAVLELDGKESTLFLSSVAESLAVLAGDRRTPAGILVAAR